MSTSSANSTPSTSASASQGVPRLGGVRCYWALVAPRSPYPSVPGSKLELEFVHPDPVLAVHLASQRLSLMGRGVLEFIHPAEREQARRDLTTAISADDLQGSVTRVRFARLSHIRRVLGCKPEELELPYDASTYAEDDEYLILDIVLNWVADGLLLAFFHAIKDKDPRANNDPTRQHEEWSNFCGTAKMDEEQIEALQHNISSTARPPPPSRFPPSRVFQLHTNQFSPVRPNSLIFSWPPPRPPGSTSRNDGMYEAKEYAELMRWFDTKSHQYPSGSDETRTSCTTRFGTTHSITTEGVYRHVSSVFIQYGSLIFACFQTIKQIELPRIPITPTPSASASASASGASTATHSASSALAPPMRPVSSADSLLPEGEPPLAQAKSMGSSTAGTADSSYGLPTPTSDWAVPLAAEWSRTAKHSSPLLPEPYATPNAQPMPNHGSGYDTYKYASNLSLPAQTSQPAHEASVDNTKHHTRLPPPAAALRPYDASHVQSTHPHTNHHHPHSYLQPPMAHHQHRPEYSQHQHQHQPSYSDPQPIYPSAQKVSFPNQPHDLAPDRPTPSPSNRYYPEQSPPPGVAVVPGGTRPLIRPPGNVECCRICGGRESPEWRRSETGIKDLCNACGLRLARQVAKREGRQKPRKKKEKS